MKSQHDKTKTAFSSFNNLHDGVSQRLQYDPTTGNQMSSVGPWSAEVKLNVEILADIKYKIKTKPYVALWWIATCPRCPPPVM